MIELSATVLDVVASIAMPMNNAHRIGRRVALALALLSPTAGAQSASLTDVPVARAAGAADVGPGSSTQPSSASPAGFELNPSSRFWAVRASVELGTIAVLSHTIQFGRNGSTIDYVREGGQNNLALFARLSAELELGHHHNFVFLYQPIDLRTQARLSRDVTVNNIVFPRDSSLDLRYGFDFYRASYAYDFFADPRQELSVGLSFQIRNASISFTSTDGAQRTINNDIGLVPALKVRGRYTLRSGTFFGFEVDGIYATIPGLNGSDIPFEGAIIDGSLRAGLRLFGPTEVFLNLRYLGGGARGTERAPDPPGDGYTNNWLHTLAISIGANIR
jgi:hypothetical protein